MKKLVLAVVVACAALVGLTADDPLTGYTKYYWNKPDGGNWNTAANWVMADGTIATDYPKAATDAAIFNGLNAGKWVSCNLAVDPGVIYLEDGWVGFGLGSSTKIHVARFMREDYATLSLVKSGKYNWEQSDIDFTVGNQDEILVDLCFCGAQWLKDNGNFGAPYSVTINESGAVKNTGSGFQQGYSVGSNKTWGNHYSLLFGNYGTDRNITFSGDYTLTIPSGQIMHHNANQVGTPSSKYQGTIASDEPVLFWSSTSGGANFRPLIQAPKFVQASRYTTIYYDDHSTEGCSYWIPQGTLQLGKSGAEDLTATCKLGTGEVNVSWSGKLDVQCAGALANVGAIRMTSYRGQGSTWGKISMSVSDTVTKAYVDGKSLKRGTYGATGSGAANIDDVHFSGAGVLTVLKDDSKGLCLIIR